MSGSNGSGDDGALAGGDTQQLLEPPAITQPPAGAPTSSGPERLVTLTRYEQLRDSSGRPESRPWAEWLPILSKHEVKGSPADSADEATLNAAKDGICYVLGEIPAGAPHENKSVIATHAAGLDLDEITDEELGRVAKAIDRWEWIAYTTHKHAAACVKGATKVRIILPLREPIPAARHKALWTALDRLTGGKTDRKTKNVGRVFFAPSTYDPAVAWAHRNEGEWLDAEALIAMYGGSAERRVEQAGAEALLHALKNGRPGLDEEGNDIAEAARAVARGEPFATPGKRHEVALSLTLWLARKSKDAPFSDEAIREVFAPSYAALMARDGEAPGPEDAITCYQGALEKVEEWDEESKAAKEAAAMSEQLARAGVDEKYTDEQLHQIAGAAGIPHEGGNPAEALRRRWIVQAADSAFYLLGHDGAYRGPFGQGMGRSAAVSLLAQAPVLLNEPTRNGGYRRRSVQELTEDYGSCAIEIVVDLTRRASFFNQEDSRMYEAARPLRRILPKYDEAIDKWLRVFAGPLYGKLCDWLACSPDLSKLLCAIYVAGHPGAGKTLLAHGVARLWSDTPGDLEKAMSDFNDEIVRCPMLLADEALPRSWKGASVTTKLRSMLSTHERTLTRKYLPPATLKGAIRLIITANNEFLLSTRDAVSGQDLAAIAQRFLYIQASEAAAHLLEETPRETRRAWQEGGIAAHALWLQANRKVEPGKRFWVEGDATQMHRMLLVSSEWASRVCEWICRYLMNPKAYDNRNDGLVRIGRGKLYVNEQAIIDGWGVYFRDTVIEPETAKIGAALRAISGRDRPHLRWRGARYRYREILIDLVFGWSDEHGIGDKDSMLRALWGKEIPPGAAGSSGEREPGSDDGDPNATDDLETIPSTNEEPF